MGKSPHSDRRQRPALVSKYAWVPQVPRCWGPGKPRTTTAWVPHPFRVLCDSGSPITGAPRKRSLLPGVVTTGLRRWGDEMGGNPRTVVGAPIRGPHRQVFVRGVEIPRLWGPGFGKPRTSPSLVILSDPDLELAEGEGESKDLRLLLFLQGLRREPGVSTPGKRANLTEAFRPGPALYQGTTSRLAEKLIRYRKKRQGMTLVMPLKGQKRPGL